MADARRNEVTHPTASAPVEDVPNLGSRFVLDADVDVTITMSPGPDAAVVLVIESRTGVHGVAVSPDVAIQRGNQLREAGARALAARSRRPNDVPVS